jgi:hypothetical protein
MFIRPKTIRDRQITDKTSQAVIIAHINAGFSIVGCFSHFCSSFFSRKNPHEKKSLRKKKIMTQPNHPHDEHQLFFCSTKISTSNAGRADLSECLATDTRIDKRNCSCLAVTMRSVAIKQQKHSTLSCSLRGGIFSLSFWCLERILFFIFSFGISEIYFCSPH